MNFIVIFADQMHKYALGKWNQGTLTPHLDRLCEEGALFRNAYSNNPICGPYRGTLMTGLYTSHNGVHYNGQPLLSEAKTLAGELNKLGYETSFVGKWHLGGNGNEPILSPLQGDFKHFLGYQCYNGFFEDIIFWDTQGESHQYQGHRTEVTTHLAIENLRALKEMNKPFLQVIGYQAPHYPEQPLPEYAKLYEGQTILHTPDYIEVDPYTPTYSPYSPRPYENCPDYQRYGNNMDEYIRLYNGMVTQVDHGVGEILKEVHSLGLEEDTLILFTSDHGDMQGSHGLKNKSLPYEKSCGVPFIVKDPKGLKNKISPALVSGIDIFPSLMAYAEGATDTTLDGRSFKEYLRQEEEDIQAFVVSEYICPNTGWQMIRDGQFKLCVRTADHTPYLLFDMEKDPYELENLIEDVGYTPIIERLMQQLDRTLSK